MRYRRRPAEIEAIQFTSENWDDVVAFTEGAAECIKSAENNCFDGRVTCRLNTDDNVVSVLEGDYIWKDVLGGLHISDAYVFESAFEEVESYEPDENPEETIL